MKSLFIPVLAGIAAGLASPAFAQDAQNQDGAPASLPLASGVPDQSGAALGGSPQSDPSLLSQGSVIGSFSSLLQNLGTDPDTGQPLVAAPDDSSGQSAAALNLQAQAVAATDPESSSIQQGSDVPLPQPGKWTQSATRDFYNSVIRLPWSHPGGDYDPTPGATFTVQDRDREQTVSIPVTGNDFYLLNNGGGSANYFARSAAPNVAPRLVVNGKTYLATRNVSIITTQGVGVKPNRQFTDRQALLVAFDGYNPQPGDKARLLLTTTKKQYGTHTVTVYHPNIQYNPPQIDAVQDGTVVADFHGSDFKTSSTVSVQNNIVTGSWGPSGLSAIAQIFTIPPAQEYFLTVVIKLASDWPNWGGKLPGLSNTGQASNTAGLPLNIGGLNCDNAGWGGRNANGCRWSARTGWAGRSGNWTGLHSYFYAQNPNYGWGYNVNWPTAAPVGQWFAYVERVRVNTPGNGDGRLSYWMCTPQGCGAQIDVQGITWSAGTLPQTLINEAWADVYCGGTSCGSRPTATASASISRMTVTVGLPDLGALYQEVQGLNASGA